MPNLVESMKIAAMEAMETGKPSAVMFGKVIEASPLKIMIEQKLPLDESFLILTKAVTDHYVDITVNHYTVNDDFLNTGHYHNHPSSPPNTATTGDIDFDPTHKHKYSGKKKIMVHNGLKKDETVVLIRIQGGQKYVVLDRISNHLVEGEWLT